MNKRKLRRVAIVALVLVLLCNTLGVQAETGAPAVTVSSYEELVNAIDQASNLDGGYVFRLQYGRVQQKPLKEAYYKLVGGS